MTDANRPGEGEPSADDATPLPTEPTESERVVPATEPVAPVAGTTPTSQPPSYPPPPGPAAGTPPPPVAAPAAPRAPAPAPTGAPAPAPAQRRRTWPRTVGRIVAFLFGVLQALLIIRIILLLLIANPDNEIVKAILTVTEPFVEPFRGMFQLDEISGDRGSVLDIAAVVALVAWSLIETLILSLLRVFSRPSARA